MAMKQSGPMRQMPRRRFLEVLGACCALVATAPPLQAKPEGIAQANEFAHAYTEWGALYEHRVPGTQDIKELRAWRTVEERFSALRKLIRLEYSE